MLCTGRVVWGEGSSSKINDEGCWMQGAALNPQRSNARISATAGISADAGISATRVLVLVSVNIYMG